MKLNRRPQVTSRDNHRPWFIRQGASTPRALCSECAERIQMVTLEEATVAAGVEPQAIHSLIEAGKLHSAKTEEAILLVCLNSLISLRDSERLEE